MATGLYDQAVTGFIAPKPDFGLVDAALTAPVEGFYSSMGGSAGRALRLGYARMTDPTKLSKEVYETHYKDVFPYDPNMGSVEAHMRFMYAAEDYVRQSRLANHDTVTFWGGLLGSAVNPIDLGINLALPEVRLLSLASRTGLTGEALLAANARMTLRGAADRIVNQTATGFYQGVAQEPATYFTDRFIGRKHDTDDVMNNIAAGTFLGFMVGNTQVAYRSLRPDVMMHAAHAGMHAAARGEARDAVTAAIVATDPEAARNRAAVNDEANAQNRNNTDPHVFPMPAREEGTVRNADGTTRPMTPEELAAEARAPNKAGGVDTPMSMPLKESWLARMRRYAMFRRAVGAADEPGRRMTQMTPEQEEIFRKQCDDLQQNSTGPENEGELLVNEIFRNVFGVSVKFFDKSVGAANGMYGLTRSATPGVIYVMRGDLYHGQFSMMSIAGHELGHVLRMSSPRTWIGITDAMIKMGSDKNFAEAWNTTVEGQREAGFLSYDYYSKMDEVYSTMLGHAMQTEVFWSNLHGIDRKSMKNMHAMVGETLGRLERALGFQRARDPNDKGSMKLGEALAEQLRTAERIAAKVYTEQNKLRPHEHPLIKPAYERQMPDFRARERLAREQMGIKATRSAKLYDAVDASLDALFPEMGPAGTLTDKSAVPGKPSYSVTRKVRGDPRAYILNLYKNSQTAAAREAYSAFMLFYKKSMDKMQSQGLLDYLRAKGGKMKLNKRGTPSFAAVADSFGPLATWTRLKNGEVEFNIYANKDFPSWHENRGVFDENRQANDMNVGEDNRQFTEDTVATFSEDDLYIPPEERINPDDPARTRQPTAKEISDWETATGRKLDDPRLSYPEGHVPLGSMVDDGGASLDAMRKDLFEAYEKDLYADDWAKRTYYELYASKEEVADIHERLRQQAEERMAESVPNYQKLKDMEKQMLFEEQHKMGLDKEPSASELADRERYTGDDEVLDDTAPQEPLISGSDALDAYYESDQAMTMSPQDALRLAKEAVKSKQEGAMDALRRVLDNLDRAHADAANWTANAPEAAARDLEQRLTDLQMDGWELDKGWTTPTGPNAPARPVQTGRLATLETALAFITKDYTRAVKGIDNHVNQRQIADLAPNATDVQKKAHAQLVRQRLKWNQMMRLMNGDTNAVKAAFKDWLHEDFNGTARTLVINEQSIDTLNALRQSGRNTLMSFLDGLPRWLKMGSRKKVTAAGASVFALKEALIQQDIRSLVMILEHNGLKKVWENNSLTKLVIDYMETGQASDPLIKTIGDTLRMSQETQAGRINRHGGRFRLLEGFTHTQVHNAEKLRADGTGWARFMDQSLDWGWIEKNHGPNLWQQGQHIFDKATYLTELYDKLANPSAMDPEYDFATMGGNVATDSGLARTVRFLPGKSFEYDMQFGSGDTGALIISQLARRAEASAYIQSFGPATKANWATMMQELMPTGAISAIQKKWLNWTFLELTGNLNNPVNRDLAAWGNTVRTGLKMSTTWMSGVSSLTDHAHIYSAARWMGMEPGDLHDAMIQSFKRSVQTPEGRVNLHGAGAGLQAMVGAYSRAMPGNKIHAGVRALSDLQLKWSLTDATTRINQEVMADLMTQHLGTMAGAPMTPEFSNWLSHYGISERMWTEMSKDASQIPGLTGPRLSPEMLTNPEHSLRLQAALYDTLTHGQFQPSVSAQALFRFGTRAGTPLGEAIRCMGMFKAFMVDSMRKTNLRFSAGYGNEANSFMGIPMQTGMVERLVFATGVLSMSYVVLGIKDVLAGREPLNPFEEDHWNMHNIGRLVAQAGLNPMEAIDGLFTVSGAIGPGGNALVNVAKLPYEMTQEGGTYHAIETLADLSPVSSLTPIDRMRKYLFAHLMVDSYGSHYARLEAWRHHQTGQEGLAEIGEPPLKANQRRRRPNQLVLETPTKN